MLIWKLWDSKRMDDMPPVRGVMAAGRACIADRGMADQLDQKGFGETEGGKLFLEPFESLYLLYTKQLLLRRGKKRVDFDGFMGMAQKADPEILTKFLIYRDLRTRGYVVKDGFGFGSDFRVYERGHYGQKGSKFLIFGLNEGRQENMGAMQKKIRQITQMGKEPIIAVIERRGEVIYYRISSTVFDQNRARAAESFADL